MAKAALNTEQLGPGDVTGESGILLLTSHPLGILDANFDIFNTLAANDPKLIGTVKNGVSFVKFKIKLFLTSNK